MAFSCIFRTLPAGQPPKRTTGFGQVFKNVSEQVRAKMLIMRICKHAAAQNGMYSCAHDCVFVKVGVRSYLVESDTQYNRIGVLLQSAICFLFLMHKRTLPTAQ